MVGESGVVDVASVATSNVVMCCCCGLAAGVGEEAECEGPTRHSASGASACAGRFAWEGKLKAIDSAFVT